MWKSVGVLCGAGLVSACGAAPARAQDRPDLNGMWSNPPASLEARFCFMGCTALGVKHLYELLDTSPNPRPDLFTAAVAHQYETYVRPRLTEAGLASLSIDPADDPSFRRCEPWGLARQIFAPHQFEITQFDDRIELRYGEWEARRAVYLEGYGPAEAAPTRMGHSIGRYEGSALVIETTGVTANVAPWSWTLHPSLTLGLHSDRLRVVERYTRSPDHQLLVLSATLEDTWALREPMVLQRAWGWAPEQGIFPYEDCEIPTEVKMRAAP
jgi:hypothetical protein